MFKVKPVTKKLLLLFTVFSLIISTDLGSAIIVNAEQSESYQLPVHSVKASSWTASNRRPENTIDGITNGESRWVAQHLGDWIQYDLGEIKKLNSIDIVWVEGRTWYYDIEVSRDGVSWQKLIQYDPDGSAGKSEGTGGVYETNLLVGEYGRYVRIVNHGNSLTNPLQNTYIAIYEVRIMGEDLGAISAELDGIRINGTGLQWFEPGNYHYKLILSSAETIPVVEAVYENRNLGVHIVQADEVPGTAIIDVASENGIKHNRYSLDFIEPSYTVKSVTANGADIGFGPESTLDQTKETRWRAEGKGMFLQYELHSVQTVGSVGISWSNGDNRNFYFSLQTSMDGENWNEVYAGQSGGTTTDLEKYTFDSVQAKYVKIVCNGSSTNEINAIFDVEIYAQAGHREIPINSLLTDLIDLSISSGKTGNMFKYSETPMFTILAKNSGDAEETLMINYSVYGYNDRIAAGGSMMIRLDAWSAATEQLPLPVDAYGAFTLHADLYRNGEPYRKLEIPFSKLFTTGNSEGSDFFGMNTHLHNGTRDIDKSIETAALSGTGWIRDSGYWSRAETEKGKIEILPVWDEYVNKAVDKGLKPLYLLAYGNVHYGRYAPTTEENREGYVRYAAAIAEHFAGRINHFEIWNEFNGGFGNPNLEPPEVYADLLKAAYPAIKAANPDAYVIGGVTAGAPLDWLERILQAGAFDYMDAVSIHPYMHPGSPEQGNFATTLERVHHLFMQYGGPKPIWISEIGWPTHRTGRGVDPLISANYAVRTHVLGMASGVVEHIFWYDLQNDGNDPLNPEHNFGLVTDGRSPVPFAAKDNFAAYSALTAKLSNATYVENYEYNGNTRIYRFHRNTDNQEVLVAWTLSGSETLTLEVNPEASIRMSDLFGTPLLVNNGSITATITETPVYFEGDFSALNIADSKYRLDSPAFTAIVGEPFEVTLLSSDEFIGEIAVDLPEGWELTGPVEPLDSGNRVTIHVKSPEQAESKNYEIYLNLMSGGRIHSRLAVIVTLSNERFSSSLVPKPAENAGKDWVLEWEVSNYSGSQPLDLRLEIIEPSEWSSSIGVQELHLEPNAETTVAIPIPGQVGSTEIDAAYRLTINGEAGDTIDKKMDFLSAYSTDQPITVDGEDRDSEWSHAVPFLLNSQDKVRRIDNWGGPGDLSGKGLLKWDSENFYMLVEVEDDIHFQENKEGSIWSGDSIQFAIDPRGLHGAAGYSEIGMALSQGEVVLWRWRAPDGITPGPVRNSQSIVTRNGTKTTYEVSIPWNELMPNPALVIPGDAVGFSLLINDNDGNGRRGWMEYGSGIGSAKDVNLFKTLFLIDSTPLSIESMLILLERYAALGELGEALKQQLTYLLNQAGHHLNKGSYKEAIKFMKNFVSHMNNKTREADISERAKRVLNTDAAALLQLWSEK